jgi:agmatine deiminase
MPAEWEPHEACLMAWPCRRELWGDQLELAKREYAAVAQAIAAFEPVIVLCRDADRLEVVDRCGAGTEPLVAPLDDSWVRDNGPAIVRAPNGRRAVVKFRFNAWGERFAPYDADARVPDLIAAHFGLPLYEAPFVLEGGAFLVDGDRTLLTTEQCLLHPNRNPGVSRAKMESLLGDYLGIEKVLWIPHGMADDDGEAATDGHVDGVAHYLAPGRIGLLIPDDPADPNHALGLANLEALGAQVDARGRALDVTPVRSISYPSLGGDELGIAYLNTYLANGAAIMPTGGDRDIDDRAAAEIGALFPDRELVRVPAVAIAYGGGGPHCITQQIPR